MTMTLTAAATSATWETLGSTFPTAAEAEAGTFSWSSGRQGLALVHFSANVNHLLWSFVTAPPPNTFHKKLSS